MAMTLGHVSIVPVSTGQNANEPVTVDQDLRAHLRIDSANEDGVLTAKVAAARKWVENRTERSLFRNQFDQAMDRGAVPRDASPIRLLRSPLASVESVTSYGTTGGATVLSTEAYFVDSYSEPGRLCLHSGYTWPTALREQAAMVVRFTAGYSTDASGIPDPLKEAIRKLATDLYENREASSLGNSVNEPLPFGIEELISAYTFPEFG